MAIRDLAAWLFEEDAFSRLYERLVLVSVAQEFADRIGPVLQPHIEEHEWGRLLLYASVLATSSEGAHQAAALRIAQHCLTSREAPEPRRDGSALVLDSLANRLAIELAERRERLRPNVEDRLPIPARVEWTRRRLENAVILEDHSVLTVNRFQRRFWTEVAGNEWTSFSAPTSAGKSYILTQWVVDLLRRRPMATVVYLVPTRALIGQVEADLNQLIRDAEIEKASVSSLPLARSLVAGEANVFVFTQERLHIFMNALSGPLQVAALIVDEAHKVGDRERGVLLQQVIEAVVESNPNAKVVFASPMTNNPEVLLADARTATVTESFVSEDVTVNQNLLWASQVPRHPKRWEVALCLHGRQIGVGEVDLPEKPDPPTKRLPFVAYALGGDHPGNVIYVNGAADAEKAAVQLFDLRGPECGITDSPELDALIDLARRTVHREFRLARVLRRGIAFHYGNLPLLIRTEIERLFSAGTIQYLICTSTLVEGVNMACRNMFLRGPKKGRGNPMSAEDFWNLAGRAGRWGKEFQGNIICVDAHREDIWGEEGPPRSRRRYSIVRTTDSVLAAKGDLLEYIDAGTPRSVARRRPDLEYTVAYLIDQHFRYGSLLQSRWAQRYSDADLAPVAEKIAAAVEELESPRWVIERNPGISPLAMDSLLRYFREREKPIEELVPADPASDDAVESYAGVFGRISQHLSIALGPSGRRSYMLALLVTKWMRGYSLARLIADRIKNLRDRGENPNIPATIREVMEDVEKIARFEAPKHLTCYTDLLSVHLEEVGRPELALGMPDLNVMLEFGVALQTQLSVMGLSLSRTSAIALSEIIASDSLTETEVIQWLTDNPWYDEDLPELVKREIRDMLQRTRRRV
jgi:hypothetical protein